MSFKRIPEELLKKDLKSLKAVYMYAKFAMLGRSPHKREYWITNPISREKEMSIDALSDVTKKLESAGLIHVEKIVLKGSEWPVNSYLVAPISGGWKPVEHDFINDATLSADSKGLAILMSLLKFIPKSLSGLSKQLKISVKTVKKYLAELIAAGVYDPKTRTLSEDDFPYRKQCREKRYSTLRASYESACAQQDSGVEWASKRMERQLRWVREMDAPESTKWQLWANAEWGLLGKKDSELCVPFKKKRCTKKDEMLEIRL